MNIADNMRAIHSSSRDITENSIDGGVAHKHLNAHDSNLKRSCIKGKHIHIYLRKVYERKHPR